MVVEDKIKKLLVRLAPEAAATELLWSVHRLHDAADPSVTRIYLNVDQSPADARLAFETRKRRREQAVQRREQAAQRRSVNRSDADPQITILRQLAPLSTYQAGLSLGDSRHDVASAAAAAAAAGICSVPDDAERRIDLGSEVSQPKSIHPKYHTRAFSAIVTPRMQ